METFIWVILIIWCAIVIPPIIIWTIKSVYEFYKDLLKKR